MRIAQRTNEISEFRDRINEYYKNIGEQTSSTLNRLSTAEANINAILKEVSSIKETANADRKEFLDLIRTLVDNLKELGQAKELQPHIQEETEKITEDPVQEEPVKKKRFFDK